MVHAEVCETLIPSVQVLKVAPPKATVLDPSELTASTIDDVAHVSWVVLPVLSIKLVVPVDEAVVVTGLMLSVAIADELNIRNAASAAIPKKMLRIERISAFLERR